MNHPSLGGRSEEGTPRPLFRLNEQLAELPTDRVTVLDVHSIFRTIQGEGPFAGEPAVFLRLAGCNLKCAGCDTDYTENRKTISVREVVDAIIPLVPKTRLVVITGGEPFRQNIAGLVKWLADHNFRVQIETNGSIYRDDFPFELATLVCSPKVVSVDPRLAAHIKHWKYVLEDGFEVNTIDQRDGLPTTILGSQVRARPARPLTPYPHTIYVQPFDCGKAEGNKRNLDAAVWSSLTFGYKLCIQLHKIAGLE